MAISSLARKQIVAITGFLLAGYILIHMSGNLLIFAGPEALNGFSARLHSLGWGLRVLEAGLAAIFFTHVYFTIRLVMDNIKARGHRYEVTKSSKQRSFATRLMPYTGVLLIAFILLHLFDYTFAAHHGPSAIVDGEDLGLYGLVYNSFLNPVRTVFYILAMAAIGFHLSHGIQSIFQTIGYRHPVFTPIIQKVSIAFGVLVAIGFGSIPIYVVYCEYVCSGSCGVG